MVQSPCVRMCTLDERAVCMGCQRTLKEITEWTTMSDQEKLGVLDAIFEGRTCSPCIPNQHAQHATPPKPC